MRISTQADAKPTEPLTITLSPCGVSGDIVAAAEYLAERTIIIPDPSVSEESEEQEVSDDYPR